LGRLLVASEQWGTKPGKQSGEGKWFDELLELSSLLDGESAISRNVRTRVLTVAFAAYR